jgi:transposase
MERYLGADVHARSCTIVVLNAAGKRIRRDVVETNGEALVSYLKFLPGRLHLCIEEGEWSQWLVEILSPHVAEFVVYQAQWQPGSKNDAIDAHGLAEKIRTGIAARWIYKDPKKFTALREHMRVYTMVTRDAARTKNRLKSFLRGRGVSCVGEKVYTAKGRAAMLSQVPSATGEAVEMLGQELDHLLDLKKDCEKRMVRESRRHPIARILETAPGMGPVRVAQLLPTVITPKRFRTKRQFWAYCGFAVVVRSSSDWVQQDGRWLRGKINQTRGLNGNYNRMLKGIFKAAATTVVSHTKSCPLHEDYQRLLANGTKPNLAKVTIARKIAAIVLAMWKREERYQPEKYREMTAA